jgi:lipoate-protein ligase B
LFDETMIASTRVSIKPINVLNLAQAAYEDALKLQHQLVAARREERIGDTLVLLEHPPVITLGRRGSESNILVSPRRLVEQGIQVHRVERGGDVTYHGPGQLVGYPILDLAHHRKDVGWYMRSLEEVLIRALDGLGISAGRLPDNIGVWLDDHTKIAALGVRIEGWITYHGFALNVAQDISLSELIVPCGLAGKEVTSMERVLGRAVDMARVRQLIEDSFCEVFGFEARECLMEQLLSLAGIPE